MFSFQCSILFFEISFIFYHDLFLLSRIFSTLSTVFSVVICDSFYILSKPLPFVKNFFFQMKLNQNILCKNQSRTFFNSPVVIQLISFLYFVLFHQQRILSYHLISCLSTTFFLFLILSIVFLFYYLYNIIVRVFSNMITYLHEFMEVFAL